MPIPVSFHRTLNMFTSRHSSFSVILVSCRLGLMCLLLLFLTVSLPIQANLTPKASASWKNPAPGFFEIPWRYVSFYLFTLQDRPKIVSPYWSINKSLHTQEKHCYFVRTPTQEWQHLILSCLQLCTASSIRYSMVLSSRYPDASVVANKGRKVCTQ